MTGTGEISDTYFEWIKRFPLRKIRGDAEHSEARKIIRELLNRGDENLDQGEVDYLEALARFVEDYEKSRFKIMPDRPTPPQVLKHLMEARRLRPADLGALIGESTASMFLNGRRQLSKAHIRKLADYFGVSPALFL